MEDQPTIEFDPEKLAAAHADRTAEFDPAKLTAVGKDTPPETSIGQALYEGAKSGATAGWGKQIEAAGAASGLPDITPNNPLWAPGHFTNPIRSSVYPLARAAVGAGRMAYEHFTGDKEGNAGKAYNEELEKRTKAEEKAQAEHPVAYTAGDLTGAGASMLALGPEEIAAGLLPKMVQGAKIGATYGAAEGASQNINKGVAPAIAGTVTGAVEGGIGGAGGELLGTVANKAGKIIFDKFGRPIVSTIRGVMQPADEGARRVAGAILTGTENLLKGKGYGLTPAEFDEAKLAGYPVILADVGGEPTRALLRSAANSSPEGRDLINSVVQDRFRTQQDRAESTIKSLVSGGVNSAKTKAQLEAQYDLERGGAYKRAYAAGDKPIWSPELERLTASPDVVGALRGAVNKWKSWQVADGYGAMNPPVQITEDGILKFMPGKGLMPYPNIQLWDYAQRTLSALAEANKGDFGRHTEVSSMYSRLAGQLKTELDRLVPEFKQARGIAAEYFGGKNAIDAGIQAVKGMNNPKWTPDVLKRTMAGMKPAEREMFQESYADEWARQLNNLAPNRDIGVNRFAMESPEAKARIKAVFGEQGASRWDAFINRERIFDAARKALGNSTTARQMIEAGLAGGAGELFLTGDPKEAWKGASEAAFAAGVGNKMGYLKHSISQQIVKTTLGRVDRNVAKEVARLLSSDDPSELIRGLRIATHNRAVANGLRSLAERASAVMGARRGTEFGMPSALSTMAGDQSQQQAERADGGAVNRDYGGDVDFGNMMGDPTADDVHTEGLKDKLVAAGKKFVESYEKDPIGAVTSALVPAIPAAKTALDFATRIGRTTKDITTPSDTETPGVMTEEDAYRLNQKNKAATDLAAETAMNMMGAGTSFAHAAPGEATLGIFGGRNAKNADLAALKQAQKMEAEGLKARRADTGNAELTLADMQKEHPEHYEALRRDIWDKTGWFRGKDTDWRFEIPDNKAEVRPGYGPIDQPVAEGGHQLVEHPELYENYPSAGNTIGDFEHNPDPSKFEAFYNPASNRKFMPNAPYIYAHAPEVAVEGNPHDLRSAVLHELQHRIQQTEGFAPGDNPALARLDTPAAQNMLGILSERLFKKPLTELSPTEMSDLKTAFAHAWYRRSAGEVEARNVQKRAFMSPEERRANPPWTTYDVPENQIRVSQPLPKSRRWNLEAKPPKPIEIPEGAAEDPALWMWGEDLAKHPNEPQVRPGGVNEAEARQGPGAGRAVRGGQGSPGGEGSLTDSDIRGSMNPLDEVPFTYKGKAPTDWTPEEFKEVGDKLGVKNLGPLSPPKKFVDENGREFTIPGGLEGKFTYYDLLNLKSQGIDPSKIDRKLHTQIQQKILRTVMPDELSNAKVWDGLIFGMTSPNNPLFPNQLSQSRLRLRDPAMIDQLANMIPWKVGEKVSDGVRKIAGDRIAHEFGLDAGSKGGLGTRGSMDYTRIAELAQMFKQDPAFFRKSAKESWDQFVERISSQITGLSMKTGSFGSVWQDPAHAAISAIDRHMANEFDRSGGLFRDELQRMKWEKRVVSRWNANNPNRTVDSFAQLRKTPGTEGHIGAMLLEYVGDAKTPQFRLANGKINPDIPKHLQETKWVNEPEKVFKMGDAYKRALALNDKRAQEHGLNLFGSQWMEWDRIRRRLEPHENMFPGLEKVPAMSKEQLQVVSREHSASGHKTYNKVDAQGRKVKDLPEEERDTQLYLKPTKPRPDPAKFGYFALPLIGAGAAAGAIGASGTEQHRAAGGRVNEKNINHTPTPAQKHAGNYKKEHVVIHGLPLTIENAKGSYRHGVGKDGKPWKAKLGAHYGYVKRTEGADGDHVDAYIGPHLKSKKVFVLDQLDPDTKAFDEHKVFLGFGSRQQALNAYLKSFSDGRGKERVGSLKESRL